MKGALAALVCRWCSNLRAEAHNGSQVLPETPSPLASKLTRGDGGEGGIRTLGELPHVGFQDRCIKPDSATSPLRGASLNFSEMARKDRPDLEENDRRLALFARVA